MTAEKTGSIGQKKKKMKKKIVQTKHKRHVIKLECGLSKGLECPPNIAVNVTNCSSGQMPSHDVMVKGLLHNLEEFLQSQLKKKKLSVFVVDKKSKWIVNLTKDLVTNSSASVGVKALAVIAGSPGAF